MRELIGNAVNLSIVEGQDEQPIAMAELIIVVSEPIYTIDQAGQMIRQRTTEQDRFMVSASALRKLIANLTEYADVADELAARASFKKRPKGEE